MRDIISKLTFGFIMAQFVPGAILVYSLSFFYVMFTGPQPQTFYNAACAAANIWSASVTRHLVYIGLAVGAGMAIHGLHWAVLGFLEARYAEKMGNGSIRPEAVFETFWHDKRIICQILISPIKIWWEVIAFLFTAKKICDVRMEENVPAIDQSKMEAFNFLQDFYLHFFQFYAHTSYALVVAFLAVGIASTSLGFSWGLVLLLASIWVVSGYFFVISRIQFASLFYAENKLRSDRVQWRRGSP